MKSNFPMLRTIAALAAGAVCVGSPIGVSAQTAPNAVPPLAAPPATATTLPYGAVQAVKMYQTGTNKAEVIRFIDDTAVPYHLTADQILCMHNQGVPEDIIDALMTRGSQLEQQKEVPPPVVVVSSDSGGPAYFPYDDYYADVWPYYYGAPVVWGGYGYGYYGDHWGYRGFHRGYESHGGFEAAHARSEHAGFHGGGFGGGHGGGGRR